MAKKAKSNVITTCVFMHVFDNEDGTKTKVITVTIDNTLCIVAKSDMKLTFRKEEGKDFLVSDCVDCEVEMLGVTVQKKKPIIALKNVKLHVKDELMDMAHDFADSCEIVDE